MSIKYFIPITTFIVAAISADVYAKTTMGDSRKVIEPTQYGYAQANAVTTSSPMLYISGQIGMSETDKNDFYSQVDRSFGNLEAILSKSNAGIDDVVKITLLIVDMDPDKLAYLVKKRQEIFKNAYPASTLIPVTRLYADGVKFEIDATAVLPN